MHIERKNKIIYATHLHKQERRVPCAVPERTRVCVRVYLRKNTICNLIGRRIFCAADTAFGALLF
jgi:hypothetical protein